MSTINFSALAFNGKEVMSLGEVIMERIFSKPALSQIHTVTTGIKAKQQIGYLGRLGLVGKKNSSCDTTANSGQVTASDKHWEPEYIADRFVQCQADLEASFFVWATKNGVQKGDLTGTDFEDFMTEVLGDAVYEAIYRLVWFGDTTHSAVGAGSGTELLTSGTDAAYFTPINGFWKQLYAIVAAASARRYTIAENAGGSYAAQALAADKGLTILEELKYGADFRLRDAANQVILVTQSIADNYAKTLRSKNVDSSFERIEGGYSQLEFEGIPVIAVNAWDRNIASYFDDGTTLHRPHRAIYTTIDNIAIGTEEESNFSEFDIFYSKDDKNTKADFGFNLDAKVVEDYMVQVAY